MKKLKFFDKMFFWISSLIFIITLLTTAFFLVKNNQSENEKIDIFNEYFIEQVSQKIDNKLAITNNIVYNISVNEKIKSYVRDIGNYYYNTIKVKEELENYLVSSSSLNYDIAVTRTVDDLIITSVQSYSRGDYYEFLGLADRTLEIEDFITRNEKSNIVFETELQDDVNRNTIIVIRKVRVFPNDQIVIFLIFYNNDLLPTSENDIVQSMALLINGKMYGDTDHEGILRDNITSDIIENHLSNQPDKPVQVKHSGKKYSVYYEKSDVMREWYYLMSVPSNGMFKNLEGLIRYYIIVWLAILLIGIFVSYITIERVKRPIRLAVEQFGEYHKTPERDELNFIVEKITEINKVNEDLKSIINKNSDILKTKFLRDLCRGLLSSEEIEEKVNKFNLVGDGWIAGIIDFSKNSDVDDMFSRDSLIQIKAHIAGFFSEQLSSQIPNEVFEYDQDKYIILMRENTVSNIYDSIKNIISIIEMSFDIDLVIVLGDPVEKINNVSESLMKAVSVLDFMPSFDKRRIVAFKDIKMNKCTQTYYYPLEIERNLIQYTSEGSKEETLAVLNYILKENIDNKKIDKENISYLTNAIITTINRILHKINKNIYDFYGEENMIFFELSKLHNIEDIWERLTNIFDDIVSSVHRQSEEETSDLAEKMILFIKLNYMKDLSLLDLSQQFNISMGYVGKIFKKHIGKNFKEFLNMYRVEIAKSLLGSNRDIKIKDLASMVGCTSDNSFIRVFRRYEGISPGQYQQEIFKNNELT